MGRVAIGVELQEPPQPNLIKQCQNGGVLLVQQQHQQLFLGIVSDNVQYLPNLQPLRYVHSVESPQRSASVNPGGFALSIHAYLSCQDEFSTIKSPGGGERCSRQQ